MRSASVLLAVLLSACTAPDRLPPPRPNVLLVMIDDLGWTDLRVQGNELLTTPVLDRLASEGMRFTDAYAASPVCSPTRAAMITGFSPARVAITNHITGDQRQFQPPGARMQAAEMENHLDLAYTTLAERLKERGYRTGFFGKWHLSGTNEEMATTEPGRRPELQGFDVNVGGTSFGGPPSYFDPYRNPAIRDRREGEYLTNRLADEAIDFMRADPEEPFFVALWPYTVHWPMEAPADLIAKYASRPGFVDHGDGVESARAYAAMIEAMDAAMGRVLQALEDLALREETLVVFTSDNGAYGGVTDLTPLRGAKGHLYEGGIRVPLIIRWPGRIPAGAVSPEPVISMDVAATVLDVAGVLPESEQLDGESLLPLLSGSGSLKREAIYFHYPNYAFHQENRLGGAVRMGDFKLISFYDDDTFELYNVREDIGETLDLAAQMPDLAQSMRGRLHAWLKESGARMPVRIGSEGTGGGS